MGRDNHRLPGESCSIFPCYLLSDGVRYGRIIAIQIVVGVWAGLHMLLHLVEWHLEFAADSSTRAEHFSEQADFLVAFQLSKVEHLLAAIVLTLMPHFLYQP